MGANDAILTDVKLRESVVYGLSCQAQALKSDRITSPKKMRFV
jgi:hypothetical protein